MSRSWIVPHSGHTHSRTLNGSFETVCPQSLHRLLEGYQRSMPISVRPYQCALYLTRRSSLRLPSFHSPA